MNGRPQTLRGVVGFMLFAMLVWVIGPIIFESRRFEWERATEAMYTGASFGIMMTAIDYAWLPTEKRLAAIHAIGLGGLHLALLGWFVSKTALLRGLGLLFMASPGLYLIYGGSQVIRSAR